MGQAEHTLTERLRENFVEVEIPAGTILFSENDKSSNAYYVVDGIVELRNKSAFGSSSEYVAHDNVSVGQVFGASKLVFGQKGQQYQAKTKTKCKLLVIDADVIKSKLNEADPFLLYLIRHGR